MSLQFSDTTLGKGIIQTIEKNCGFKRGDISGNTTLLQNFTADVNLALDKAMAIILPASGRWTYDDSNNTDYPIIATSLVSGQRDYAFTVDGSGNLVLDIYKVLCKDQNGIFHELAPANVNAPQKYTNDGFTSGQNLTGLPNRYDKRGNAIFLDLIPSYNSAGGLEIYINREGSYFTTNDTTKKPGFAGLFHEYLALRPSYFYAMRKGLANKNDLEAQMLLMEKDIEFYYGGREKDTRKVLKPRIRAFR